MDVREFLPHITDEEVETLRSLELSGSEWVILKKVYREKISRYKTIGRKDLRQAFPSDRLDCAESAIDSLLKKGIIEKTPKPTSENYHSDRSIFNKDIVLAFLDKMTEDDKLRKALIYEKVEFKKPSETLKTIVENYFNSRGNKKDYLVKTSPNNAFDGDLALILDVRFKCDNHKPFVVSFEISCPNDLFESKTKTVKCECGNNHICLAIGVILSNVI